MVDDFQKSTQQTPDTNYIISTQPEEDDIKIDIQPEINYQFPVSLCDYHTIHFTRNSVRIATYATNTYTNQQINEAREKAKSHSPVILQWKPTGVLHMEMGQAYSMFLGLGQMLMHNGIKDRLPQNKKEELIHSVENFLNYLKNE